MGNEQQKIKRSSDTVDRGNTTAANDSSSSVATKRLENGFHVHLTVDGGQQISESYFQEAMFQTVPAVARLLKATFLKHSSAISLSSYLTAGHEIVSLSMDSARIEFYSQCLADTSGQMTEDYIRTLLACCLLSTFSGVGVSSSSLSQLEEDVFLAALLKNLLHSETTIDVESFNRWCLKQCPRLFNDMHLYICDVLYGETSDITQRPFDGSDLLRRCLAGQLTATPCTLWLVSLVLPDFFFPELSLTAHGFPNNLMKAMSASGWSLLYNSRDHGLSVNRFLHFVMDYDSPTLMFIAFEKLVYAVAMDTAWKESSQRWGGSSCCFLQLLPEYRIIQSGDNLLYLNIQDRTLPKGLHIGRDPKTTFLKINDELTQVNYYGVDYKLISVEVWGCGPRSAYEAQQRHKQWELKEVDKQKNRKLVPEDWKDNPDRQLLEMGGVQTEHAQRGDV